MASSIKSLITRQAELEGLINQCVTNLRKYEEKKIAVIAIQAWLEIIKSYRSLMQKNHVACIELRTEKHESITYFEDAFFEYSAETYIERRTEWRTMLKALQPMPGPSQSTNSSVTTFLKP